MENNEKKHMVDLDAYARFPLVQEKVKLLLKENEGFRNSDTLLIFAYWLKHNKEALKGLVHPATIIRRREEIQHEHHMYPPTDAEVRKRRGLQRE